MKNKFNTFVIVAVSLLTSCAYSPSPLATMLPEGAEKKSDFFTISWGNGKGIEFEGGGEKETADKKRNPSEIKTKHNNDGTGSAILSAKGASKAGE